MYVLHGGYRKCGSSLLSAILNSHKNIVCPMANHFIRDSPEKSKSMLIAQLLNFHTYLEHDNYSYAITGAGITEQEGVRVYSNKGAWENAELALKNEAIIKEFISKINMPIKCLISLRNPYLMVEGMWSWKVFRRANKPLESLIESIDRITEGNKKLEKLSSDSMLIRLENLISNKKRMLNQIAEFLEVDPYPEWIEACSNFMFREHKSGPREKGLNPTWTDEEIKKMNKIVKKHKDYFSGYTLP